MDKETNIISDEDFLKEIFTEVSEKKESNIVQDDLEKELDKKQSIFLSIL